MPPSRLQTLGIEPRTIWLVVILLRGKILFPKVSVKAESHSQNQGVNAGGY